MLLTSTLLLVTLTAVPAPRAWDDAETVVHLPSLERAEPLLSWFEKAGRRALLLRPASWREAFHPLLLVDPGSAESMDAAGLSRGGPVTLSMDPRTHVTCASLASAETFRTRMKVRLEGEGTVETKDGKGFSRALASREGKVVAGYAIAGEVACAFRAPAGTRSLGEEIVSLARGKPKSDARFGGLEGEAFFHSRQGALALSAEGETLLVRGLTERLPAPELLGAGATPYGTPGGEALFTMRTRLPRRGAGVVIDTLERSLRQVCEACESKTLSRVAERLAPHLTGQALAHARRIQVKEPLRTARGRYLAVRHALLAEVNDAKGARAALGGLLGLKGATKTEDGVSIAVRGGALLLGLRGDQVYLANDAGALEAALAAVGKHTLPHGATFSLAPKAAAEGLAQISLLDAIGGGRDAELIASLFALSTELGPLLAHSASIEGWADPVKGGGHRVELRWTLSP